MLAAIRNATNVKVVFRIKDPVDAEELAHTVVPLDLEIPVRTLAGPTVIGHRRIWLRSESESEHIANTHSLRDPNDRRERKPDRVVRDHARHDTRRHHGVVYPRITVDE
jgi:hypothetical protein